MDGFLVQFLLEWKLQYVNMCDLLINCCLPWIGVTAIMLVFCVWSGDLVKNSSLEREFAEGTDWCLIIFLVHFYLIYTYITEIGSIYNYGIL